MIAAVIASDVWLWWGMILTACVSCSHFTKIPLVPLVPLVPLANAGVVGALMNVTMIATRWSSADDTQHHRNRWQRASLQLGW